MISVIVTLAVIGFLLWLVETQVPMDGTVKQIIRVVVIVVVCLWLLQVFGLIGSVNGIGIR